MQIQQGWINTAQRRESPYFNPRSQAIDMVVIHCISLPEGNCQAQSVIDLFQGRLDTTQECYSSLIDLCVSAHLLIDRQGQCFQLVPFYYAAWHAGESLWQGKTNCNDFSIGIELLGTDSSTFTDAQYNTLKKLTVQIKHHYKIECVVGHSDIAPQRKTDPGSGFDWDRL